MERVVNAEKILFNQLTIASNKFPNANFELVNHVVNGVLSAMNLHTMQYLNPVRDLLKQLSKIKAIDLPMNEINKVQALINSFFNKPK